MGGGDGTGGRGRPREALDARTSRRRPVHRPARTNRIPSSRYLVVLDALANREAGRSSWGEDAWGQGSTAPANGGGGVMSPNRLLFILMNKDAA
jgi:hypothetical protein